MTDLNDPNMDAKTLRFYSRHNRRKRWRQFRHRGGQFLGAAAGLVLSVGIAGGGVILYRDHTALNELLDQQQGATATSMAPVPVAAVAPTPHQGLFPSFTWLVDPPKDLWVPGTWETAADQYLQAHAYDDVSSAIPPPHRPRHQVPHRHVQPRSAAP